MDADNIIPSYEAEVGNGNHYEHPFQEQEVVAKVASGSPESPDSRVEAEVVEISSTHEKNNDFSIVGVDVKVVNKVEASKPHIGCVKDKANNVLVSKNALSTLPKKNGNAKAVKSNGTMSAIFGPKEPVTRSRLVNDGHVNGNPSKITQTSPAITNAPKAKQPVKSESATFSENLAHSESLVEKEKLRPLTKGPPTKTEGESETILSPSSTDAKPNRLGKLPSYCFSFKCDERAERRKEFYSKLEEKIHAMEAEKSNLQAKSKETQEAEIKMLRKSLAFKATPMPSFYQEPAPAKVELKKIPPTRPKSPKLGRNKSSATEDAEGESNRIHRPGRLSLDERNAGSKPAKVPSPANVKKPSRRSLPRLPSEKTNLPNRVEEPTSVAPEQKSTTNVDTHSVQGVEEPVPGDEPCQTQSMRADVPFVQDDFQPSTEPQPVAAEQSEGSGKTSFLSVV
ncbi:hypothetical protein Dimus_010229 [Dionaea muscipula]